MITLKYDGREITVDKVANNQLSFGYSGPDLFCGNAPVLHLMHDRIQELEAQLASVGAGGVSKLHVGEAVLPGEKLTEALRKVVAATSAYLEPNGPSAADTIKATIQATDPWPTLVRSDVTPHADTIEQIAEWFGKAFPNVDDKARAVQFGVHLEEVAESLEAIYGEGFDYVIRLHELADEFKANASGVYSTILAQLTDSQRADLCDAMVDQLVTNIGVMKFMQFDIMGAVRAVITANYDKFVDGQPIYKPNGKLDKRPGWEAPNLAPFSRKVV